MSCAPMRGALSSTPASISVRPSTISRTSSAPTPPPSGSPISRPGDKRASSNAIRTRRKFRFACARSTSLLFSPVPYLTKGFPYLKIDPDRLAAKGIDFETAATAQGFLQHGEPIAFENMPALDFCVVGCVAVTRRGGRTGKGAGFADLEQGIFRELGKVTDKTPIATCVHSSQLVAEHRVVMEGHDSALNFIATELELIETETPYPQPQ